tara:strand:- start:37695 stop:38204 length:510 start_codon:yes stop_codon:yes gene_type:complete
METPNTDIEVTHDALLGQIEARTKEEHARQSDAGESSAKITKFLEDTGLNGQAFSWLKTIMKKLPKKNGEQKAMDIIRSLNVGLPMLEDHIVGQGTQPLGLGEPADYEGDGETPPDDDGDGEEVPLGDDEDADPDISAEAEAFDKHLAEVEDTNVTPMKPAAKKRAAKS